MLQHKNDHLLRTALHSDGNTNMKACGHDKLDIEIGGPSSCLAFPFPFADYRLQQPSQSRRSVSCERTLPENNIHLRQQHHHHHTARRNSPKARSRYTFIHSADKPASNPFPLPPKRIRRSISSDSLRHDLGVHFSTSSSTMQFLPKQNRQLQLPSFEELGIATPSPNNMSRAQERPSSSPSGSGSVSHVDGSVAASPSKTSTPFAESPNSRMDVSYPSPLPITPPESDDHVQWNPSASHAGSLSDTVSTDAESSGAAEACMKERSEDTCTPKQSQQGTGQNAENGDDSRSLPISSRPLQDENDRHSFLQNGILTAVSSLTISTDLANVVQLVSQTLPCPPSNSLPNSDSLSPSCVFSPIVQTIQSRLQPDQSPYINITHAVPPKFSLSSLPTSPPSTPNRLFPGDDYFNMTVFSNATATPHYPFSSTSSSLGAPSQAPYVPTPIVPPYSVNIAAVERYLPPTSTTEYQNLFTTHGPSVLLDRLRELSPRNGTLLLVYPTLRGAQCFKQHYLNPILDPLLRQLVVLNCLPSDIGTALSSTPALKHMDPFETMHSKVTELCSTLTARDRTSFTLSYASAGCIPLSRPLWTEWYISQETPRAREILDDYWRNDHRTRGHSASKGMGIDREVTSAMVLREVVDGIRKRALTEPMDDAEREGVEVGVFVIRRSQTSQ
ncbi:uncharacterized protein GIQ15_01773 [Arthroderma uncinatum]|uniref:uncharacterized protein n=1 Tax=Arthroderma uncinatum TaxID=74035 RepID=UPI00144ACCCC|nr:uncharacterized protein GIQ15_01773 [Arthroderma uncinatum]KAF3492256.1 hypothetical protein GIQ15_01773 [Arthroderma uncinatum]